MRGVAYVSGEYVPVDEASIPILDLGFLHSDVTYDVVHVWNRRFFRLKDHIDRFRGGIAELRLELPISTDEMRSILFECVERRCLRGVLTSPDLALPHGFSRVL